MYPSSSKDFHSNKQHRFPRRSSMCRVPSNTNGSCVNVPIQQQRIPTSNINPREDLPCAESHLQTKNRLNVPIQQQRVSSQYLVSSTIDKFEKISELLPEISNYSNKIRKVLLRHAAYPIGDNLNHGFWRTSILDFTRVNRQPNQSRCFTHHWTPLIIVCRILLMMDVSVLRPIGGLYLPPDKLAWQYRCSCMLRTDKGPRSSLTLWSDQVSLLPLGPALLPFAHVPRPASIFGAKNGPETEMVAPQALPHVYRNRKWWSH